MTKFPELGEIVLAIIEIPDTEGLPKIILDILYNYENQWYKKSNNQPLEEYAKVIEWRYQREVIDLIKGES